IQGQNLSIDLFAPFAFIVRHRNAEVVAQQIEYRQISRRFAVPDRKSFQRHPARIRRCLELIKQARLANPGLGHDRDDLPVPRLGLLGGIFERLNLALAPNELAQPAPRGDLEVRAQRTEASDLEQLYGLADPLDPARAEGLELEVALDEFLNTFSNDNRTRRGQCLQACGSADRMSDGSVFGMLITGLKGTDNYFSAIDSHAN